MRFSTKVALGLMVLTIIFFWIYILYSQLYIQNSPDKATKGIIFKNSLILTSYKKISSGNDLLGHYDNYSRSDRHNEMVKVYCKEYCKEIE